MPHSQNALPPAVAKHLSFLTGTPAKKAPAPAAAPARCESCGTGPQQRRCSRNGKHVFLCLPCTKTVGSGWTVGT